MDRAKAQAVAYYRFAAFFQITNDVCRVEKLGFLETTDRAIEAIANDVGYQDTSFFTRLFRRRVGLTPGQYRLRFGALRRALSSA